MPDKKTIKMNSQTSEGESKLLQRRADFLRKNLSFYYSQISFQQSKTAVDRPVRGPTWVSRAAYPPTAGKELVNTVIEAIRDLGNGEEVYDKPTAKEVKVQWTGYRRGVGPKDPEPNIEEGEKYQRLVKDMTSDTVVYFIHGGFHWFVPSKYTPSFLIERKHRRARSV